jgi:hypothetical protein
VYLLCDKAQLCFFIREVSEDCHVMEELHSLESFYGTVVGTDWFEKLESPLERKYLEYSKIEGVCSGGHAALTRRRNGCMALLVIF